MRWRHPLLGALLLVLLAPSAAWGDAPRPGGRYDGRSSTGQWTFVKVASDGSRLSDYDFVVRAKCREGGSGLAGVNAKNEPPTPIDASGSFARTATGRTTVRKRGGGTAPGTSTTTYRGTFKEGGRVVTGTIETTISSRLLHCSSGPVPYTLALDGTPGALFRDSTMATGGYRASGRRLSIRFRGFAPDRSLRRVSIAYRARCRTGTLRDSFGFDLLEVGPRGGVRASGRARTPLPGRIRNSARYRLRMRLTRRAGRYVVRGTLRLRSVIRRSGRRLDTCSTGTRRFRGSFRSGPPNIG